MTAKGILRGIGAALGVIFIVLWWIYPLLAPFLIYRLPADNEYSAQEAVALDGFISCSSFQDWYVTTTMGPCADFVPPLKIAVGEHFRARGTNYEIRIILATHIDIDYDKFKKGDWYCEVAESPADLDHRGKEWRRTWLLIPKCQPIR